MFVIREAQERDIADILVAAEHLDSVNLPARKDHIAKIVELSLQSFAETIPAVDREYVFVLEDTSSGRVIGTSMIHAQHGTRRSPHIYFQVMKEERYSQTLDRYLVHQGLRLGYNYNGPTEIGGLILLPEYRGNPASLGKLLSYVRFLFIAIHRPVFRDEVISELLPPLEADGTSVLWEHLGKRFTGLSYQEADFLSKDNKEFIRALFPHGLIYTSLFPDHVQRVIGEVGEETKGVEKILRRIGFQYANQIDPFDGGPHFKAETDKISVVQGSRKRTLFKIEGADSSRPWAIVSSQENGFRATGTRVIVRDESVGVPAEVLELLQIQEHEQAWCVLA